MAIYRYGKLQKLVTRKEGYSYIDQVKTGLYIFFLIKNGGYSYIWQSWKMGLFGPHIHTIPLIGSYPPPPPRFLPVLGVQVHKAGSPRLPIWPLEKAIKAVNERPIHAELQSDPVTHDLWNKFADRLQHGMGIH